jgi:hydrogenase/urease accessory protein HupE
VLDAIALEVDGARLAGAVTGETVDADTGTTLHVVFEATPGTRLAVRSGLPARLTPGHRELLTVRRGGGQVIVSRMLDRTSGETTIDLAATAAGGLAGADFVALGVRHILGGPDHLLFLAALLLGPGRLRGAVRTVTAFTVAHSVTLSLAVLGLVPAPAAIVEPLIALSIVWVGLENLRRRQAGASRAALTFAFGLVHGLGFATALQELGIGAGGDAAVPLLAFNAGVEAGQVGVVLLLWGVMRAFDTRPRLRLRVEAGSSLAVAVAGACWFVARVAG